DREMSLQGVVEGGRLGHGSGSGERAFALVSFKLARSGFRSCFVVYLGFDMMLVQVAGRRDISPGFLIHDSHLFDAVDERQNEKAWAYGAAMSEALGFQYIVTLNSDQIPAVSDRETEFDIHSFVLEPGLSDGDGGGLFGFEFE
ncbi:MAG: DUF2326 domain-containing protein, partial [Bacteroidota bacterium]